MRIAAMVTTVVLSSSLAFALPPPGGRGERRPARPAPGQGPLAARMGSGEGNPQATAAAVRAKLQQRLSPAQQQNLATLKNDLMAVRAGSSVSQTQVQQLARDLQAMAQGSTRPSQASVQKLAADLQAAVADSSLSLQEKATLAADVGTVMQSAGVSQQEVDAVVADAQDILQASGVTQQEAQAVAADLQAIAATAQANAQAQ